jgi:RNA-directed DNA polymerase
LHELCAYLNISPEDLQWICKNINSCYRTWEKKKKSGKSRELASPNDRLREIQEKLLVFLRTLPLPVYIHTGQKGRSIKTNAEPHYRAPLLVKIDIRNFYPNIRFPRVLAFFEKILGLPKDVSWHLSRLMTFKDAVPQGAITSPTLAALIAFKNGQGVAAELHQLASNLNGRFSIYGDDANLSGPIGVKGRLIKNAKRIINRNGFEWHPDPFKTAEMLPGELKTTPGVDVTHGPDVPLEKRKEYRRELTRLERKNELNLGEAKSMRGKVAYMSFLNPGAGKHYLRRIKKLKTLPP